MKNKKGFMTVYICLFFLALVSIIMLLVGGVKQSTLQSSGKSLSRLWAQSILAEYDLNLQQRYHLFGFYGYPAEIKEKLNFYGQESFGEYEAVSWEISSCVLFDYSLQNVDVFKEQMIKAGKMALGEDFSAPAAKIVPVMGHAPEDDETLFDQLPSAGSKGGITVSALTDLLKSKSSLQETVKSGSGQYFETVYIFSHFKDKLNQRNLGDTYFNEEIEYIIGGKHSDEANEKYVRNRIIAVREVLNLLYLHENEKTRNEALAVAEVLTPGPAAVATQQTLLGLWAFAESVNDYRLLSAGYRIPLMKSELTWATDLTSAMENDEEGFIYTGIDEGEDYEDYLRFFVYTMDERVRILRTMDLIQINFRWLYYDSFLLREYNSGLKFSYSLNGKKQSVELCYD